MTAGLTKKKITIVYLLPGLRVGGTERQLLQHLHVLVKKNEYVIHVVTLSKFSTKNSLLDEVPVGVQVKRMNFRSGFSILSYVELYKILFSIKPDIVVSSLFLANTCSRVLKPFLNYKTIAREHNVHPERNVLHRIVDAVLARIMTDCYLAVSNEAAEAAARSALLPVQSVNVIQNGVDLSSWKQKEDFCDRENSCRVLNLDPDKKYVVTVARLARKKRLELLLQSFEVLHAKCPEYELVVVGEGSERERLEKQRNEMQAKDSVHFLGSRSDVEHVYSIAEVFVLTSSQEGFPNVLLEALFFGVAIVSTDVPGLSAVLTHPDLGEKVDSDPEKICEAIIKLSKRSGSQVQRSKLTAKKHIKKFDVVKVVDQYEKLFREVLK